MQTKQATNTIDQTPVAPTDTPFRGTRMRDLMLAAGTALVLGTAAMLQAHGHAPRSGGNIGSLNAVEVVGGHRMYASAETSSEALPSTGAGCRTDQHNCQGMATFRAGRNTHRGFTIWYENGARGHLNFVIGPGGSHQVPVRSGDRYSWVEGNRSPDPNAPRSPINVD